jgi:hypothetical protein
MKNILFIALLFCFAACNNTAETNEPAVVNDTAAVAKKDATTNYVHHFADTALENKITAALLKLPFVKKSSSYIDSLSNHQHGISFMLDNPTAGETDISVQAGYNGAERFETYYRFFVNPSTLEIKIYDPVEDKKLTVKEYLKTQK